MFREMDSTRQPAEGSTGRWRGCQKSQEVQNARPQSPAHLPEEAQVKQPGTLRSNTTLTIGNWGQLQHCVKRTLQVGHFVCRESKAGRLPHPLSKSRFGHLPQHLKLSHTNGIHFPAPAWTGTPISSLQSSVCHPSSSRINPLPTRVVELTCTFVQEVSKETAHDRLVTDHKDILLSLQLHDDRL